MKKSIITATLLTSLLLAPSFTFALVATNTCPQFTRDLALGSTDAKTKGDVTKLQDVLVKNGFLSSTNLGAKVTKTTDKKGVFGVYTQNGLKNLQLSKKIAKKGDTGFGRGGPGSRKALNGLCTGNNSVGNGVPQAQMRTTRMMAKIVPDNSVTNTGTVNYGTQQATGGVTATGGTISSNDAAAINAGTASLKKGTLIPAQ